MAHEPGESVKISSKTLASIAERLEQVRVIEAQILKLTVEKEDLKKVIGSLRVQLLKTIVKVDPDLDQNPIFDSVK